jgi:hypothetical protein
MKMIIIRIQREGGCAMFFSAECGESGGPAQGIDEEEKAQPLVGPSYNLTVTKRPIEWQYISAQTKSP